MYRERMNMDALLQLGTPSGRLDLHQRTHFQDRSLRKCLQVIRFQLHGHLIDVT